MRIAEEEVAGLAADLRLACLRLEVAATDKVHAAPALPPGFLGERRGAIDFSCEQHDFAAPRRRDRHSTLGGHDQPPIDHTRLIGREVHVALDEAHRVLPRAIHEAPAEQRPGADGGGAIMRLLALPQQPDAAAVVRHEERLPAPTGIAPDTVLRHEAVREIGHLLEPPLTILEPCGDDGVVLVNHSVGVLHVFSADQGHVRDAGVVEAHSREEERDAFLGEVRALAGVGHADAEAGGIATDAEGVLRAQFHAITIGGAPARCGVIATPRHRYRVQMAVAVKMEGVIAARGGLPAEEHAAIAALRPEVVDVVCGMPAGKVSEDRQASHGRSSSDGAWRAREAFRAAGAIASRKQLAVRLT